MRIRITILGSTGSIGRSALDVVRHYPDRFEIVGLGANSNVETLAAQVAEFYPDCVAVADADACKRLDGAGMKASVLGGPGSLEELASRDVDVVLCAMVGAVGLKPVLRAIDAGNRIALANKEPLVMAGPLIIQRARDAGVEVLPVDSEHSAIFQCLEGRPLQSVRSIYLTASGGPFYGRSRESLAAVSPNEAAQHPTWDMGAKISVDSATLMNKGLEVIEAMWLFGVPFDKMRVVIHAQSIVHGLVEFNDGSILAHMGVTDMKCPILFAFLWPQRAPSPMATLDLTAVPPLTFDAPDLDAFPCLGHALEAARAGGLAPAVLNAANEVAVDAFCAERISFLEIADVVGETLAAVTLPACSNNGEPGSPCAWSLDEVLAADHEARVCARTTIERLGK